MILTALALRVSPTIPPRQQPRLVPAVDDADAATLNREALSRQRAALIASLWPRAGRCVLPSCYLQLPAPALFGPVFRVSWRVQMDVEHVLPRTAADIQIAWAA
jgi:hypothetical protein